MQASWSSFKTTFQGISTAIEPVAAPLIPVVKGISFGHLMNTNSRHEASVKAGHNYFLTAIFQCFQIYESQKQVLRAFKAAGRPINLPFVVRNLTLIFPIISSLAVSQKIKNPLLKRSVYFIHQHIGKVAFVAGAVASVALIAFGQYTMGIASITCLTIGILGHLGVIPFAIRRIIYQSGFIISTSCSLILGDPFEKCYSAAELTLLIASKIFKHVEKNKIKRRSTLQAQDKHRINISLDRLNELNEDTKVDINRYHIHWNRVPPPPKVDLLDLLKIEKQIDWSEKHMEALKAKLAKDERWLQRGLGTGHELEFMRSNLSRFVARIKTKNILEGEPHSYEPLVLLLKHIIAMTKKLDKKKDDTWRVDIILRLAIEGGEYCGPGVVEVVEDVYSSLRGYQNTSFEEKTLGFLRQERNLRFHAIYDYVWKTTILQKFTARLINNLDLHIKNSTMRLLANKCGFSALSAKDDGVATASPMQDLILQQLYSPMIDSFWKGNPSIPIQAYDANFVIDTLQNGIGNPQMPLLEYYKWWIDWIDRQQVSIEEKEKFKEMLSNGGLEETGPDGKRRVKRKYIIAMAFELGLIK